MLNCAAGFLAACSSNNFTTASQLLAQNPNMDVNHLEHGWTFLHSCCEYDHVDIARLLLDHPDIDPNITDEEAKTPLFLACYYGNIDVLAILLDDYRVDVNLPDDSGRTPVWSAAYRGKIKAVKYLLASGRQVDLGVKSREDSYIGDTTPLQAAKKKKRIRVVKLLEEFMRNPAEKRAELRRLLKLIDLNSVRIFVMIVFICDGYFELKDSENSQAIRFFRVATQLPQELQMFLSNRVFDCADNWISTKRIDAGIKQMLKENFIC